MSVCELLEIENINKGATFKFSNKFNKNIFFLSRGTVKIIDTINCTTKYIVKKGNIFGELSLYDEQAAQQEQAVALEDCIVCNIDSNVMEQLMSKHETLKNGILKVYGLRIKKLERRLEDLIYKDSPKRIEKFINSSRYC
jgi:CRP/FNR family transcriptional regulator